MRSPSFEAELSYENEDFYQGKDESFLIARLGLGLRYKILDFVTFSDRLLFSPNIGQGGQYVFLNEVALTAPLGARWVLRLTNIIDYNSNPPAGFDRANVKYLMTLGVSF